LSLVSRKPSDLLLEIRDLFLQALQLLRDRLELRIGDLLLLQIEEGDQLAGERIGEDLRPVRAVSRAGDLQQSGLFVRASGDLACEFRCGA
jgi:hypothetical protein